MRIEGEGFGGISCLFGFGIGGILGVWVVFGFWSLLCWEFFVSFQEVGIWVRWALVTSGCWCFWW